MGRVLRTAGFVVAVVLGTAALARWMLHGPVSAGSLSGSVARAAGHETVLGDLSGDHRCERRATAWRCEVIDYCDPDYTADPCSSSRTATYVVVVRRGSSCWSGRLEPGRTFRREPPPTRLSGCIPLLQ